jgi:subtilase family serine protease
MPSKSTFQKAKKMLQSDGFEVNVNGIGLNVSTSKENFEKVLNVKLIESKSQNQAVYKTDKRIDVPINWKAFIESIDLPVPVEYY